MKTPEEIRQEEVDRDWQLVLSLGGPAKVAERLGWTKEGSVQRVQNWKQRGIPAKVKLANPRLFPRRKPAQTEVA